MVGGGDDGNKALVVPSFFSFLCRVFRVLMHGKRVAMYGWSRSSSLLRQVHSWLEGESKACETFGNEAREQRGRTRCTPSPARRCEVLAGTWF